MSHTFKQLGDLIL
uniref:Uncharacterized protein n=1 Tax=Arundo donax TaxID=35708 RepID=A0A0A9AHL4_ARUDO